MTNHLALAISLLLSLSTVQAEEKVLNIYSARHYQTDEKLYDNFTRQTGIKLNRIEGRAEELLERIRNEGANSPADLLITVDAGMIKTSKNREATIKFFEYLASDEAQVYFADGNNEWPSVPGVITHNESLEEIGKFDG